MSGSIVLIIAVVLQVGYTGYCLLSGSRHKTILHALRFGALGVLSLLLLLQVFEWGARWITLLVVLLVLSIISTFELVGKKAEKPLRKGGAILKAVGGTVLFATAVLPAVLFPQYKEPTISGDYQVATALYTYVDETRTETYSDAGENRSVNVALWYPEGVQGKFPLVVFSHGFCGIKNSNLSAFEQLAANGYVVCSIDHPYHSYYTVDSNNKVTMVDSGYMQEYADLSDDKQANLRLFQKWMDIRVTDLSFVIDTILDSKGGVYELVDDTKIGVFGHSLGGSAAMGVPRVRKDIGAVINIDAPMMCELTGVENDAYTVNPEPYPAPLLNIYSQFLYDNGILAEDEEYFQNRLVSATAPASFEVVFHGAQHMSLTDLSLVSPILAGVLDSGRKATIDTRYCLETLNGIMLQFFDAYLKDGKPFTAAGTY